MLSVSRDSCGIGYLYPKTSEEQGYGAGYRRRLWSVERVICTQRQLWNRLSVTGDSCCEAGYRFPEIVVEHGDSYGVGYLYPEIDVEQVICTQLWSRLSVPRDCCGTISQGYL
jgi:hypothetical protein